MIRTGALDKPCVRTVAGTALGCRRRHPQRNKAPKSQIDPFVTVAGILLIEVQTILVSKAPTASFPPVSFPRRNSLLGGNIIL